MSTTSVAKPKSSESNGSELSIRFHKTEIMKVEAILEECAELSTDVSHFARAFKTASALRALSKAMTSEMMNDIMELQGSALGFRTDKDRDGGYPVEVVKECAIDCLLRGGHLAGNEMNIIAGRAYYTKEFFTRRLASFPGLTDLRLSPGVPAMATGGALVPYTATWNLNGRPDRIECLARKSADGSIDDERICVKVNSGMGADAILGKAERKIRARIYSRITGTNFGDSDIVDVQSAPAPKKSPYLTDETSQPMTPGEVPLGTPDEPEATDPDASIKAAIAAAVTIDELMAINDRCHRDDVQAWCNARADQLGIK